MNVSSVHLLITHRRIEKDSPKVFPMRATEFYIGVLKNWYKIVVRMNKIFHCVIYSHIYYRMVTIHKRCNLFRDSRK